MSVGTAPRFKTGNDKVISDLTTEMRQILERFKPNGALDWSGAESIVARLMRLFPASSDPVTYLRSWGGYEEAHAINMAVLCLSVGRGLGFNAARQKDLALAALFHDLGKQMPTSHPRKAELMKIEEHGAVGRALLSEHFEVLPRIAEWVGDHHERLDGSGPKGKKDPALEAQILGLCDLFDANLTPHPTRRPLAPHTARTIALDVAPGRFAPEVIAAFAEFVQPYPPEARVLLTGGAQATVVTPATNDSPLAPVIRAGDGEVHDLSQYAAPRVLDLVRYQD